MHETQKKSNDYDVNKNNNINSKRDTFYAQRANGGKAKVETINGDTKINHYHKIHKNVRNRARKFEGNNSSTPAFLGGLFTDLTASEDTLLLENGEVHQMCETTDVEPTIKMPSIFGSITNVNSKSALGRGSPAPSVAGGARKKHHGERKSVVLQSPAKENSVRKDNQTL